MQLYRVPVLVRGTLVHSQLVQEQPCKLKVRDKNRFCCSSTLDYLISERMKNRRIKVAAFYTSLHPNLKVASALRLAGEWLRNAGFVPGDVVAVEVAHGRLVITKTWK